ncbi:MerR family transcriptional regulator [Streptomyces varsoviensis]|uniref:MerR family transcriptional regulator n=1 Tax=Streptomyces varsoviensis TaxID=67373 RepID=A0ABR5J3Z9_9ACTN|nr:MerR family transcriptional regulator [Streptomyces varsoviensis]
MLIGDVARRSGVSARMLRHYESLGLVRPTGRTEAGYREYSGDDIRRIFHIESLRSLGLSLRDVGRALDDPGFKPAELVDDLIRQTRDRIARETELLTRLGRIGAAEPSDWEGALHIVALLQGLGSESAGRRQRAALSSSSLEGAPVPVEALVEAALAERDPNVAGALRWALTQAGEDGLALLAQGLDAPAVEVRKRAVQCIAEFPDGEATALLRKALADSGGGVRRGAALALGARGATEAIPTLVEMVVEGIHDADAADVLGMLALDSAVADRITEGLVDGFARGGVESAGAESVATESATFGSATSGSATTGSAVTGSATTGSTAGDSADAEPSAAESGTAAGSGAAESAATEQTAAEQTV